MNKETALIKWKIIDSDFQLRDGIIKSTKCLVLKFPSISISHKQTQVNSNRLLWKFENLKPQTKEITLRLILS